MISNLWLVSAVALLAASTAAAQVAGLDLEGVHIDRQGILRQRETDFDGRLADLHKRAQGKDKEGDLCYISLPRLFTEAKKHLDAGEPLPDRIRYLGGMVKLQYIFIYPDEGDIVIAGRAEPFDSKVAYRPLGEKTGRPVLQLDDLVTALRAAGPGRTPPRIGCDILITQEIADRVDKKVKEISPKLREMGAKAAADAIAEAGGMQPLKYYGVEENTRFAIVCAEADYRLKQLGLALIKSPASKVKPYFMLLTRPEQHHRFSLESHYEAILASPDSTAFELKGPSLKINGGILRLGGAASGEPSDAAKKYIAACNENYEELCRSLISWADLANLTDLVALAALVGKMELHSKAKWDTAWIMDPNGYPVARLDAPKGAAVLCNHRTTNGMVLFTSGGVGLFPKDILEAVKADEEAAFKGRARRPEGSMILPTQSAK